MRNLINLVATLFLLSPAVTARAQAPDNDGVPDYPSFRPTAYIIIGGGPGIPAGNFHSTALNIGLLSNTIKSGFANTGFLGFTEFAIPFTRSRFGFAANTASAGNPANTPALSAANDKFVAAKGVFSVASGSYRTNTLLCGLYYTFPVRKFTFDVKALAGYALCYYPSLTISCNYPAYAIPTRTITTPATTGFTYGGNATARYSFATHFCAFAQAGFFVAQQNYSTIETLFNYPATVPSQSSKPINATVVNISVGAGYLF